jgi:hypothetical protein
MTPPSHKYHYTDYNQYDVLRLNWVYWAITLFLSRHLILFMLLGISAGRTGQGPRNPALAALLDPVLFVSDLPALLLLFVAGARLPKSGRLPRILWRQGRSLLVLSAVLYIGLVVWQQQFDFAKFDPVTWGLLAVNIILIVYLLKSPKLGDLFSQFPAPVQEGDK